ncbi:MAG: secondary thiamine-phosphate synthase enzyme YjbQ [Natronospirillum sp.]|uniref:secondary thiamine-phosphate synthase enzyme YjbQ n=1 Tax=Natronospirillum sp. TaxID=2812955 RepID=UPI0025DEE6B9|nr:secondary thiamine-phosphate synthase enzyme YjbQ [Natronospirillum sp.]MCH8551570.1 secondary thiamine-phosphate synthase enzyme YjbQ [Natronospirillum sp.]
MTFWQTEIRLRPRSRGFHLITDEIESALAQAPVVEVGLVHLLLKHTSASLTVNENADPSVRSDFETFINRLAPDVHPGEGYEHTYEGPDDLPAHFKSSLLGCELTLPITGGRINLGTWQGVYLGEHRNRAGSRSLVLTLQGE